MSGQADQLDQFIDALNAHASLPAVDHDPQLARLCETVKLVHNLTARDWPDGDFGSHLARDVFGRLNPSRRSPEEEDIHPISTNVVDLPQSPPVQPEPHVAEHVPWYREGLRLVAGILVLVAVGALLAATFGGHLFGDRSGVPAGQPNTPQSIYGTDPDLQQAYSAGWGRYINQTQTSAGFRVTLRWVGSDAKWIFVVLQFDGPPDHQFGSIEPSSLTFSLPNGPLQTLGTSVCSRIDFTFQCVYKYARPTSLATASSTVLTATIPALRLTLTGSAGGPNLPVAVATPEQAARATSVGLHPKATAIPAVTPIARPGPFKFTVLLPLHTVSGTPSANEPLSSRAYVVVDGFVDVFDTETGDLLHKIPLHLATQSPFIAADAQGDRLVVTDAGPDGDMLTVYRTTDWSVERQVHVPDIMRYLGIGTGIAVSSDGRYVYVYNYNDRTQGSGPVDYWLATYDVQAGQWLDKTVDLHDCGVSQLMAGASGMVYVRCYNTGELHVVDPIQGTIVRTMPLSSVVVALGESVYTVLGISPGPAFSTVDSRGAIQVLNASTGSVRMVPQNGVAALPTAPAGQSIGAPDQPLGISPNGRQLFVPIGSESEYRQQLANSIAVIDTQTGKVIRWIEIGNAFHWIAFSPDDSFAFVEEGRLGAPGQRLVRVDLQTGAQTSVLQAPLSPQMVVAP